MPVKGGSQGLSNVYTRITDADIKFISPEEKLKFNVWIDIDVWNQMSSEITLNPCDIQMSANFIHIPVNDTVCKNTFPITLKPGINKMIDGIAKLNFIFPADAFPGVEKTDITINLSTSVEMDYLLNATVYGLAVNLSANNPRAYTDQTLLDPLPKKWGEILDDPNLPPLHFRISRAYATAYYLAYKSKLNVNVRGAVINTDSETATIITSNTDFAYIDITIEGNFSSSKIQLSGLAGAAVTEHKIPPGTHEFSFNSQPDLFDYSPAMEKNADYIIKYVITGRDPNNPHFIPFVILIRNGIVIKITSSNPGLETPSLSVVAISPMIPYGFIQYRKKRMKKGMPI